MQTKTVQQDPFVTQWILWGALIATYFVYGFVAKTAGGGDIPTESWTEFPILMPLGVCAVGTLALSHFLPKMIFRGSLRLAQQASQKLEEKDLVARMLAPNIVGWALSESVTVYGLVIALGSKSFTPYLIFAAAGITNMLILRPSKEKWMTVAKESGLLQPLR